MLTYVVFEPLYLSPDVFGFLFVKHVLIIIFVLMKIGTHLIDKQPIHPVSKEKSEIST